MDNSGRDIKEYELWNFMEGIRSYIKCILSHFKIVEVVNNLSAMSNEILRSIILVTVFLLMVVVYVRSGREANFTSYPLIVWLEWLKESAKAKGWDKDEKENHFADYWIRYNLDTTANWPVFVVQNPWVFLSSFDSIIVYLYRTKSKI